MVIMLLSASDSIFSIVFTFDTSHSIDVDNSLLDVSIITMYSDSSILAVKVAEIGYLFPSISSNSGIPVILSRTYVACLSPSAVIFPFFEKYSHIDFTAYLLSLNFLFNLNLFMSPSASSVFSSRVSLGFSVSSLFGRDVSVLGKSSCFCRGTSGSGDWVSGSGVISCSGGGVGGSSGLVSEFFFLFLKGHPILAVLCRSYLNFYSRVVNLHCKICAKIHIPVDRFLNPSLLITY